MLRLRWVCKIAMQQKYLISCILKCIKYFTKSSNSCLTINFQNSSYKDVLDHVFKCRGICKQLGLSNAASDPTPSLLSLYEFEAKLELGANDLDSMLAHISSLPGLEAKTLETMAALCVRCSQPSLSVQALRLAIQHHLRAGDLDGEKLGWVTSYLCCKYRPISLANISVCIVQFISILYF